MPSRKDKESIVGRNGISAMFDKERTLKLTLDAEEKIEKKFSADGRVFGVAFLLTGWVSTTRLRGILLEMLNAGRPDGSNLIQDSEIQAIYEGYIDNTGHREDLVQLMRDVHEGATKNPTKFQKEKAEAMKKMEEEAKKAKEPSPAEPST
jgi:hypothetical protein